jgi:hypothetical protein
VEAHAHLDAAQPERGLGDRAGERVDRGRRREREVDRLPHAAVLDLGDQRLALGDVDAERLLAEHRLAGGDGGAHQRRVRERRHRDVDHVDVEALDRVGGARGERQAGEVGGRGSAHGRRGVPRGHHLDAGARGGLLEHPPPDHAEADHRHPVPLHPNSVRSVPPGYTAIRPGARARRARRARTE